MKKKIQNKAASNIKKLLSPSSNKINIENNNNNNGSKKSLEPKPIKKSKPEYTAGRSIHVWLYHLNLSILIT